MTDPLINRRGFIGTLLGLLAAPFMPSAKAESGFNLAALRSLVAGMSASNIEGPYYVVAHPDRYADLVAIIRRDQWADAYRAWRKAGRPGDGHPQTILDTYDKTFDTVCLGSEIGSIDDVLFVTSGFVTRV